MISVRQRDVLLNQLTQEMLQIYECTPISEEWTAKQVAVEMARNGRNRDISRVLAMLGKLNAHGVVDQTGTGSTATFKRTQVRSEVATKKQAPYPETDQVSAAAAAPAPASDEPKSVIGILAPISTSLRALADQIDAAAIEIDEISAQAARDLEKFNQLRALLKG